MMKQEFVDLVSSAAWNALEVLKASETFFFDLKPQSHSDGFSGEISLEATIKNKA